MKKARKGDQNVNFPEPANMMVSIREKISLKWVIARCSLKRERFAFKNGYIAKCFGLLDKRVCLGKLTP